MAFVGISNALREEVRHNLSTMRTAEMNTIPEPSKFLSEMSGDNVLRDMAVNKLWEPLAHLRTELSPYDRECTYLRVRGVFYLDDKPDDPKGLDVDFKPVRVPCFVARDNGYYDTPKVEISASDYEKFAPAVEAYKARYECSQRWDKVIVQVLGFLDSCKSLNEAVKLWPDVLRYVPKHYQDRLAAATAKAQKESKALEALKNVDLDTVAASTVLARMAGAAA